MSETTPRPDETPGDPAVEWAAPPAAGPASYSPPPPHAYAAGGPGAAVAGPDPMSPADERTTGMAAHGVALGATVLSGGTLGFVAALVMYLIFRDRGPFVRHHTANALNVQIIVGVVMLISLPLMLMLVGFVTFAAAWLFAVIVHVIGMVKANSGEWWNPPITPHFVK